MHVMVTGGAGFIGLFFIKKLLQLGWNGSIIDNLSTGLETNVPNEARLHQGDTRNVQLVLFTNTNRWERGLI